MNIWMKALGSSLDSRTKGATDGTAEADGEATTLSKRLWILVRAEERRAQTGVG